MSIKNIIIVVVDALRASNLGCYGYPLNTSPQLDAFAETSLLFDEAYACTVRTDPAFTSISTGFYPTHHGVLNHANRIQPGELARLPDILFLAEILRAEGFETYGLDFLSRWHKRGFDYYIGLEDSPKSGRMKVINAVRDLFNIHPGSRLQSLLEKTPLYNFLLKTLFSKGSTPYWPADRLVDLALRKLEDNPERRKFIFLHFWDTHSPYYPPKKYEEMFARENYGALYPESDKAVAEIEKTICSPLTRFFFRQMAAGKSRAEDLIRAYDGEIRFVDDALGRLLKNTGEDDLVLITADHGESLTEHKIYFTHEGVYRPTLHIPFLLLYPNCPQKRIKKMIQTIDILPTVLDLAGVDTPENLDGQSLLKIIENNNSQREYSFAVNYSGLRKEAAVFSENYKYISAVTPDSAVCEFCGKIHRPTEELYNLRKDPGEKQNIVELEKLKAEKLRNVLERFMKGGERKESVRREKTWSKTEEEEVKKRLKSLGYF